MTSMRRRFFPFALLVLLGAGCTQDTVAMPDVFYAHGSWRFDGTDSIYTASPSGAAAIDLTFTREQGDQYLVEGDVTYDDDTFSCRLDLGADTLCRGASFCEVRSTTPGVVTGVAVVRGGELQITTNWVVKPDEAVTAGCTGRGETTNSGWHAWLGMGPRGANMIDGTWVVDIADAAFIDDLPTDIATDEKAMSASFSAETDGIISEGLVGLYREKP